MWERDSNNAEDKTLRNFNINIIFVFLPFDGRNAAYVCHGRSGNLETLMGSVQLSCQQIVTIGLLPLAQRDSDLYHQKMLRVTQIEIDRFIAS